MLRYLLPLIAFIVLTIFLYMGLGLNPRDIGSTRLDKPAPTFSVPQLMDQNKTFNNQEFLGKVSLLNVWASWCVTCRAEHSLLMELSKQSQISIYGLNYKDKLAEAKAVLEQTGDPYLISGFDEKGQVGMDWGVTGTPETFVIDKQGIVRYKQTGPLEVNVLQQTILPLMEKLAK